MTTIFYAGILALIYLLLSLFVIRGRWKYKVGIGHGESHELRRRIQVHANFGEYVPFALLILFLNESVAGASAVLIHILGSCLVLGRLLHARGLTRTHQASPERFIGMNLTFATFLVGGARLVWVYLSGLAS